MSFTEFSNVERLPELVATSGRLGRQIILTLAPSLRVGLGIGRGNFSRRRRALGSFRRRRGRPSISGRVQAWSRDLRVGAGLVSHGGHEGRHDVRASVSNKSKQLEGWGWMMDALCAVMKAAGVGREAVGQ